MGRNTSLGFTGAALGGRLLYVLDYAGDAALLPEMIAILALSLDILDTEAPQFRLEINWQKTKSTLAYDNQCPYASLCMLLNKSPGSPIWVFPLKANWDSAQMNSVGT